MAKEPPATAARAPSKKVTRSRALRVDTLERKTPVSVGVIDKNEIERRGIYELKDVVGVVAVLALGPGLIAAGVRAHGRHLSSPGR